MASGVLTRSTESFKVLTECPLIVMLLFQLYPRYIQTTIPSLIPMMVQTLALRPPRAGTRHRLACADFMAAQVKTLSFLTYLLRCALQPARRAETANHHSPASHLSEREIRAGALLFLAL